MTRWPDTSPKFHVVLQILSVVQSTVRLCKKPFIIVLCISSHLRNKLEFSVLLGSSSSDVTALWLVPKSLSRSIGDGGGRWFRDPLRTDEIEEWQYQKKTVKRTEHNVTSHITSTGKWRLFILKVKVITVNVKDTIKEKIIRVKQGFSLREASASRQAGILMSDEIFTTKRNTWLCLQHTRLLWIELRFANWSKHRSDP